MSDLILRFIFALAAVSASYQAAPRWTAFWCAGLAGFLLCGLMRDAAELRRAPQNTGGSP